MKKLFTIILAAAMVFCLASCGGSGSSAGDTSEIGSASIDLENAAGQDLINYFTEIGLFKNGDGYEVWTQDHATYWTETPVSEAIGWWDTEGTEVSVMILILDPSQPDSSEDQYNEWMEEIRTNKNLPGDYAALGVVDHLVGNLAFSYSVTTLDDDALAKVEAAYEQFLADSGAEADF